MNHQQSHPISTSTNKASSKSSSDSNYSISKTEDSIETFDPSLHLIQSNPTNQTKPNETLVQNPSITSPNNKPSNSSKRSSRLTPLAEPAIPQPVVSQFSTDSVPKIEHNNTNLITMNNSNIPHSNAEHSIFTETYQNQKKEINSQTHSPFIVEEKPKIEDSMSDDTSDDEVDEIFPLMTNNSKRIKLKKKYYWIFGLLIGVSAIVIIFTLIIIAAFVYFIIDGNK